MSDKPYVWEFNLDAYREARRQEEELVQSSLDECVIVVWETNIWDDPDLIEELLGLADE